ncbi:nuclear polyadenylated RNA-binding protein 3, partial [Elasticomyces elasticus]
MTLGPPPETPQYTSEPTILSPASPKPLHFPQPSNIPILGMQMDPMFDDTATHMDPLSSGYRVQLADETLNHYSFAANAAASDGIANALGQDSASQTQLFSAAEGAQRQADNNHHSQEYPPIHDTTSAQPPAADGLSDVLAATASQTGSPLEPVSAASVYDSPHQHDPTNTNHESVTPQPETTASTAPDPTAGDDGSIDYQALLDNITR